MKAKWESMGGISGNEVLVGDGFYVSYMPPGGGAVLTRLFDADDGGSETALCIRGDKKTAYFILNGDFRAEYEKAIALGLDACKAVFTKHESKHRSSWSEPSEAFDNAA